jgi:hypothetical protein
MAKGSKFAQRYGIAYTIEDLVKRKFIAYDKVNMLTLAELFFLLLLHELLQ